MNVNSGRRNVRLTLLWLCAMAVLALATYWALAQPAPPGLANYFPTGPLLYLEARDFATLLADWNSSPEKQAWLTSANYQVFSRSHLFLRLGKAQTEFAVAAGIPPDFALLTSVAGTNSALGMYNIGSLEFLYVSRLESARALNTALWKARGTYQTRNVAGVEYYVKEDPQTRRLAAFAYTNGFLVLATKEELIAGALQLMTQPNPLSVAQEKWFADAIQAAPPGANDLRLVYNLERLLRTPQFRSYWAQRNATALGEFSSGLADLERTPGELRERRVLLRATPSTDLSASEAASGQLLAMVPDDAGLYRVWSRPASDAAERLIEDGIFDATASASPRVQQAPGVVASSDAGSELDLETRIDEAPLLDDRSAQAFRALHDSLGSVKIQAMLQVSNTRVDDDQVFVRPQSALVIEAAEPWDAGAFHGALTSAAGGLWTNAGLGAGWRARANGTEELAGLGRLVLSIDGRRLILSDSAALMDAIVARGNQNAVSGAVYAAGWKHARELPNFERMMRLIDFPQMRTQPAAEGEPAAREPMFYSENMASFGRALQRLQSATVTVHDQGPMLRESVVYRIAP